MKNKKLLAKKNNWEKNTLNNFLQKSPLRKKQFFLSDLSPQQLLYTPLDIENLKYENDLGFPGEYPFTRGVTPTMYTGKFWTRRQYSGFGSAKETNERFKFLLKQGQTGLSIAFDLPTQMGYDSDDPIAKGEVGKVGVAIDSIADGEVLFKDIDLSKVSTSMTINATASILLCIYLAIAEKQNVSYEKISGTIQNDILKEYIARGTYIFPPKESIRLITDIFKFASNTLPRFNTISISGYHIREAGANAVQEIAFTLANAICYIENALKCGLKIDDFAPRLSFFFGVHNNFLEEIAKFRAARRLYAKIIKTRFKAKDKKSMLLRFHSQTCGSTLTAQQPQNNIVRVTLQALASVLGGTQSLHTNSFDEALQLPTETAVQIALRTQQLIACESGVADTVDALGGSYCIENLTNKLEEKAKKLIEKIDNLGGSIAAIEKGFFQKEIQQSAYLQQKQIENKENIVVGINKFTDEKQIEIKKLKIKKSIEKEQIKNLKEFKKNRSQREIQKIKDLLSQKAQSKENLIPYILSAVKNEVTIGEICESLKKVFGVYKESKL